MNGNPYTDCKLLNEILILKKIPFTGIYVIKKYETLRFNIVLTAPAI
jgi:hypothetical protein